MERPKRYFPRIQNFAITFPRSRFAAVHQFRSTSSDQLLDPPSYSEVGTPQLFRNISGPFQGVCVGGELSCATGILSISSRP